MTGLYFPLDGHGFAVVGDGNSQFNDCNHLYNFLNYLYRTDRAQKWTNGETPEDIDLQYPATAAAVPGKRGKSELVQLDLIEYFQSEGHRALLHDLALDRLKRHYDTTNLMTSPADRCARSFLINTDGEDIEPKTWGKIAKSLYHALADRRLTLVSAVVHNDQDVPHLHGLYLRKPRMRGNPFVDAMLSSELGACVVTSD